MTTPTLGYENDSTIAKGEIGRIQLIESINLFVLARFLPALTLAGAAEEILGKLVAHKAGMPTIKDSARRVVELQTITGFKIGSGKSERELIDMWNGPRNNVKHVIGGAEEPLTINFCDEAYYMIERGLGNAKLLDLNVPNEHEFRNWLIENVT